MSRICLINWNISPDANHKSQRNDKTLDGECAENSVSYYEQSSIAASMRQEDTWLLSLQSQYRITKRSAVLYDKIWHNDSEKSKKTIIKDSDNKKSSLRDTKLWTAISYAILSEQTRQLWFILECLTTVSKAIENKLAWYLREFQVETGRILNQIFFEDFHSKKLWTGHLFVTQMVSKENPTNVSQYLIGNIF